MKVPVISAELVAASVHPDDSDNVLYTWRTRFPLYILPQMLTHRVFARNTASRRAIPTSTLLAKLDEGLFEPAWTGKQGGMKGHDNLSQEQRETAWYLWRKAYEQTKVIVQDMELAGIAKEVTNRLLAPFEMTECIITTNMVGNYYSKVMGNSNDFFAQRISPHAQTEIRLLAEAMLEATKVTPHKVVNFHGEQTGLTTWQLTAKYARVSYTNFDKDMNPDAAETWCRERLLENGHMSPMEHVALPTEPLESGYGVPFPGWTTLRSTVE